MTITLKESAHSIPVEMSRYALDKCRRLSEIEFKKELGLHFSEHKVSAVLQEFQE